MALSGPETWLTNAGQITCYKPRTFLLPTETIGNVAEREAP